MRSDSRSRSRSRSPPPPPSSSSASAVVPALSAAAPSSSSSTSVPLPIDSSSSSRRRSSRSRSISPPPSHRRDDRRDRRRSISRSPSISRSRSRSPRRRRSSRSPSISPKRDSNYRHHGSRDGNTNSGGHRYRDYDRDRYSRRSRSPVRDSGSSSGGRNRDDYPPRYSPPAGPTSGGGPPPRPYYDRRDNGDGYRRPYERPFKPRPPSDQPTAPPSNVLGIFGLSPQTTSDGIREWLAPAAEIQNLALIKDRNTGWSKGYAFVYYNTIEEATRVRNEWNNKMIDGRQIRVDFSKTTRPYSPTPGRYMGREDQREASRDNRPS